MTQPVPATSPVNGCNPTGRSSVLWESLRELPVAGENFGYLLWRKKQLLPAVDRCPCLPHIEPIARLHSPARCCMGPVHLPHRRLADEARAFGQAELCAGTRGGRSPRRAGGWRGGPRRLVAVDDRAVPCERAGAAERRNAPGPGASSGAPMFGSNDRRRQLRGHSERPAAPPRCMRLHQPRGAGRELAGVRRTRRGTDRRPAGTSRRGDRRGLAGDRAASRGHGSADADDRRRHRSPPLPPVRRSRGCRRSSWCRAACRPVRATRLRRTTPAPPL